jgi:RecJ-like exonuclease
MATGCSKCDGTGKVLAYQMIEQFCGYCGGTGKVVMPPDPTRREGRRGRKVPRDISTCPTCRGRGRAPTRTLVPVNCDACQGKGHIWSREHFPDGQLERRSPGFPVVSFHDSSQVVPQAVRLETASRDGQGRAEGPALASMWPRTLPLRRERV